MIYSFHVCRYVLRSTVCLTQRCFSSYFYYSYCSPDGVVALLISTVVAAAVVVAVAVAIVVVVIVCAAVVGCGILPVVMVIFLWSDWVGSGRPVLPVLLPLKVVLRLNFFSAGMPVRRSAGDIFSPTGHLVKSVRTKQGEQSCWSRTCNVLFSSYFSSICRRLPLFTTVARSGWMVGVATVFDGGRAGQF